MGEDKIRRLYPGGKWRFDLVGASTVRRFWQWGRGPRSLAGNPDSSQAVVFLTSTVNVIVGL